MSIAPQPSFVKLPCIKPPYPSILDFLSARFPNVDREIWIQRICAGKVLNKKQEPIHLDTPYESGGRLYYFREVISEPEVPFQEEILWQDEHLIVIAKPHFLPVTPGGKYVTQSVIYRVRARLQNPDIVPLHRLDRATAGIVLLSACPQTRAKYDALFTTARVHKTYLAVAHSRIEPLPSQITIQNRLAEDNLRFLMRVVPGIPNATTQIQIRSIHSQYTFFQLHPLTGKTHQLRVHLQTLGCPIVNDFRYPTFQEKLSNDLEHPLQLLAKKISFTDPLTHQDREFTTPQRLSLWAPDLPELSENF